MHANITRAGSRRFPYVLFRLFFNEKPRPYLRAGVQLGWILMAGPESAGVNPARCGRTASVACTNPRPDVASETVAGLARKHGPILRRRRIGITGPESENIAPASSGRHDGCRGHAPREVRHIGGPVVSRLLKNNRVLFHFFSPGFFSIEFSVPGWQMLRRQGDREP